MGEEVAKDDDTTAPSQRREPRRRGSLVVYDDKDTNEEHITVSAEPVPIPGAKAEADTLASSLEKSVELSGVDEGTRRDSIAMLRGTVDKSQMYTPPLFALTRQDTDVPPPVVRDRLVVEDFPVNTISTAWIKMVKQGLNEWIRLPAIICRGAEDG